MITKYLTNHSTNNHRLEVISWLKVKKGYVVPASVLSFPFVDLKHDLRFIAIIRPRKEIHMDEKKIALNSVFTFIVSSYCRIDCVSKEVHDLLNISKKVLDHGLLMHHVFRNFNCEKMEEL